MQPHRAPESGHHCRDLQNSCTASTNPDLVVCRCNLSQEPLPSSQLLNRLSAENNLRVEDKVNPADKNVINAKLHALCKTSVVDQDAKFLRCIPAGAIHIS